MAEATAPATGAPGGGSPLVPFADILKNKDILLTFGIVAIVIMMVVPLPPVVLDIFLTLNICLALVVLLVSIYTKETLQFSVFPSLLLIATLFRLALNVSSTRVILLGYGNQISIIKAFGNFVVSGNYVVGIVVFTILVVIQFIVITKGAERVAEVAARFTLDAMPGKQMSIDADLNAGLITDAEAKERRRNVQREADFFGAMDGASKFVKGDAIAGIIVTIVNILGGLVIGVFQRGEAVIDAARLYTLFTVGDGLVTQIPALLIATATGIVVTRAGSDTNMGEAISSQLFSRPKILGIASAMIGFLGLIPGLPKISFFLLSALFGVVAYITHTQEETLVAETTRAEKEKETKAPPQPEDVSTLLTVDQLEIEIGYNLIPLVDTNQGGSLLNRITMIRRQMALDLGLIVPPIRIRDNIQLPPSVYVVKIKGAEMARYEVIPDQFLAMNPGTATENLNGIQVTEPAFGLPAQWIVDSLRERAEMAGYTVVDPATVIATHLTEVLKANAHEILGRQELQQMLDSVKKSYPLIVDEVVPNVVTHSVLLRLLQQLLREQVSIRNLVSILEALADAKGVSDPDALLEMARQALCRQIVKPYINDRGVLGVISLDPRIEQVLNSSLQRSEGHTSMALDPKYAAEFFAKVKERIEEVTGAGLTPILLCAGNLRLSLKRYTERISPRLVVIAYNEIPSDVPLESVGVVSI